MAGETFGNYQVVATLGKGGMGVVFLAEHQRISRSAAIKVLSQELTTDPDVVKRFFIEARATSLIRHPGIVEVFDCDVDAGGRAYIVMEYLEGETLASCLRRVGALPWRMACAVAERIAHAVGAAHECDIVHRDLKPENVFLSSDDAAAASPGGEVKILDFGVAKLLSGDTPGESITRTGMVLGTPLYISPEQCGGSSADVDHRADVYSLGCMLFEMICGRPPFEREEFRGLLAAHMFHPPPLASSLAPAIPAWLDQLIARMLAKQPSDRPASMAEVADTLAPANHGEGRLSLPVQRCQPAAGGTRILSGMPRAARRHLDPRQVGIAAAAVVGGLAAAAIVAVALWPAAARTGPTSMAAAEGAPMLARTDATEATGSAGAATAGRSMAVAAAPAPAIAPAPATIASPTLTLTPTEGTGRESRRSRVESRAPAWRRASAVPSRTHRETPHAAPVEADGIVDL